MFNRVGTTNDALGVGEGMDDSQGTPDGKNVNVSAKFYLAFTSSREQAYRMIQQRHLLTMNQLQYYFTQTYSAKNVSIEKAKLKAAEK